ncbi:MAG TPA: Uma2 family endonuclease [Candidatus Limnocylindrales bacterium]
MNLVATTMTPAEYDKLPSNPRVELVDGVVHVMPPATRLHQEIVDALKITLSRLRPSDLVVVREQELRLRDDHRRNPDLMVIDGAADDPSRYSFTPDEVVLAIEVVSPGTETIDRMHKHAEYCNARVPHYWRVEIRPKVTIHTYQLGETGVYLETGAFEPGDTVAAPGLAWAKVAVSDLVP